MYEIKQDVEGPGEDDGEEEGEAGEVHVPLGAVHLRHELVCGDMNPRQEETH